MERKTQVEEALRKNTKRFVKIILAYIVNNIDPGSQKVC